MWYKNADFPTPFLLVDLEKVRAKFNALQGELPGVSLFYALKANPAARIVAALLDEACGMEVTSPAELSQVLDQGGAPAGIISSNPIKTPAFLSLLHEQGVRRLAFDSTVEVDKIARWAPGSELYLRIQTDNTGAAWPLSHKFGVPAGDAPALLRYAANRGLHPIGLTFHVGSQCQNPQNWPTALQSCADIIAAVAGEIEIKMINLGGGLPIQHNWHVPGLAEIAQVIRRSMTELFDPAIEFCMEPGRFLVGDAAVLVTQVIGRADRPDAQWLYLDAGVFNGLMETIEQFYYPLDFDVEATRRKSHYTIAGPSCDSVDKMFVRRYLPELAVGEKLFVLDAGAYTNAYAGHFNGFPPPMIYYTDELTLGPQTGQELTTPFEQPEAVVQTLR